MKRLKIAVFGMCIAVFLITHALADENTTVQSFPMLSEYFVSPDEDGKYHFKETDFQTWDWDAGINGKIRCVAIAGNGNTGVISTMSSPKGYTDIVSVFSENGTFITGYQFDEGYRRGDDFLFFNDKCELCYYITRSTSRGSIEHELLVLGLDGTGVQEFYTLPSSTTIFEDIDIHILNLYKNAPRIYIAPDSPFVISEFEEAKLVIRRLGTQRRVTIYDQSSQYLSHKKETDRQKVNTAIIVVITMAVVFFAMEGLAWIKDRQGDDDRLKRRL